MRAEDRALTLAERKEEELNISIEQSVGGTEAVKDKTSRPGEANWG